MVLLTDNRSGSCFPSSAEVPGNAVIRPPICPLAFLRVVLATGSICAEKALARARECLINRCRSRCNQGTIRECGQVLIIRKHTCVMGRPARPLLSYTHAHLRSLPPLIPPASVE